jgi:hypothetical protein
LKNFTGHIKRLIAQSAFPESTCKPYKVPSVKPEALRTSPLRFEPAAIFPPLLTFGKDIVQSNKYPDITTLFNHHTMREVLGHE